MVSTFECQLVILELLEHNPIFTVGYRYGPSGLSRMYLVGLEQIWHWLQT